jgi:asparagine synthase (glutamine-hydrolysing)
VHFGHRRLAIIDLSDAGRQPMLNAAGDVGIVFNGCIYNFQELRRELEQAGRVFRSHCDTEVLVEGYQEWGVAKMLPKLRGMFAFAIWDQKNRRLTMARDRLGVKPLVYAATGQGIAFASTVGALREAGYGGEIDPAAVLEFLEYGFVTDERCIYEGLRKLPPATMLEWQDGRIRESTYWVLPECDESGKIGFEEAVEETERLLVEAVRLRLIADVPVGALLSGGIDSALICWATAKLNANVKAYTVGVPGETSETAAAAQTARILGIPHEVVTPPAEKPVLLDEMLAAYSEPFGSQSAQGMLMVSRVVKPTATVLLTGDGGDDVYLGYPFFLHAWRAQKLRRSLPASAVRFWRGIRPLVPKVGLSRRASNFLSYATDGIGAFVRAHDGLPYLESRSALGDKLKAVALAQRQIVPSGDSARRLLSDVFEYHLKGQFLSEFMTKVDGATMHYALEARSPLLDHKIWEFAAALSPEVRFHGGGLKAVLREIVRRRVSPEIAGRVKQGFTVPVGRHLTAGNNRNDLEALRKSSKLEQEGWLRQGSLARLVEEAGRSQDVSAQLWHLLLLEHWLNEQGVPALEGSH